MLGLSYRPIDDIRPHPDNVKAHDLNELRASVKRFGFTTPLLVCERTGLLAAGHGRLELAMIQRDLGSWALDGETPSNLMIVEGVWRLPVITGWSSTDDDELKAYLLADNGVGPLGGWHEEPLAQRLRELADTALGFEGTGFTPDYLDTLIAELGQGEMTFQPTEAAHAPVAPKNEPTRPRELQGLHEVGLAMNHDQHEQYLALMRKARSHYGRDTPSAEVVINALTVLRRVIDGDLPRADEL